MNTPSATVNRTNHGGCFNQENKKNPKTVSRISKIICALLFFCAIAKCKNFSEWFFEIFSGFGSWVWFIVAEGGCFRHTVNQWGISFKFDLCILFYQWNENEDKEGRCYWNRWIWFQEHWQESGDEVQMSRMQRCFWSTGCVGNLISRLAESEGQNQLLEARLDELRRNMPTAVSNTVNKLTLLFYSTSRHCRAKQVCGVFCQTLRLMSTELLM